MARTATGGYLLYRLSSLLLKLSVETSTKTATRRANTKSKDSKCHARIHAHILSVLSAAEGKTKRPPTAYNLYVKEHMKTYLADNPGKTNKDAMKHVGLVSSCSSLHSRRFLDWRFVERRA